MTNQRKIFGALGSVLILSQAVAVGCGSGSTSNPFQSAGSTATVAADMLSDFPTCSASATPAPASHSSYYLPAGATPADQFFLALLKDDDTSVTALAQGGVDPNSVRPMAFTVATDGQVAFSADATAEAVPALFWAAKLGTSGATIKALLASGAKIGAKSSTGQTALMAAASNDALSPAGFQALIDAGADIKARDNQKGNALLVLASSDNRDPGVLCNAQQKLQALKNTGKVNFNENLAGYTPMMAALKNRNLGLAKLIRALGGDVNGKGADGSTPLHAVAYGADDSLSPIKWLIKRGVNPSTKNAAGQTALDVFEANLAGGVCFKSDPARPTANLCEQGERKIVGLLQGHTMGGSRHPRPHG